MAVSQALRRLGGKWPIIRNRIRDANLRGITPEAFADAHLRDVSPTDCYAVIKALGRHGDLWIGLVEGEELVFSRKPEDVKRAPPRGDPQVLAMLTAILPDVVAFVARGWKGSTEVEIVALGGQKSAVGRIVRKLKRATARGLPLATIRAGLWAVFPPALCEALARYDRGLARDSTTDALWGEPANEAGADIGGDGLDAKIMRLLSRRGGKGADRTTISKGIRPFTRSEDISKALFDLTDQGLIYSVAFTPYGQGRKRDHYFMSDVTPPPIDGHGYAFT